MTRAEGRMDRWPVHIRPLRALFILVSRTVCHTSVTVLLSSAPPYIALDVAHHVDPSTVLNKSLIPACTLVRA